MSGCEKQLDILRDRECTHEIECRDLLQVVSTRPSYSRRRLQTRLQTSTRSVSLLTRRMVVASVLTTCLSTWIPCEAWTLERRACSWHGHHVTVPSKAPALFAEKDQSTSMQSSNFDATDGNANSATSVAPLPADNMSINSGINNDEDDNEDEYDYIEYDTLTEAEFVGSEWLIGTNWDRNPAKIDETWARLVTDESGKNVAIWGDKSQGTWNLDVASQFLSISKENVVAGKEIWACTVTDYYYLTGTVRGWKYWSAAAVLGQWQAKRLGVAADEAGTPPWFQDTDTAPLDPQRAE
jgi:hypothetical protein